MTVANTSSRPFEPGTTGWTADDLLDPQIDRQWEQGRYEIIEGVLTTMPAAYYDGNKRLKRLTNWVERYLRECGRSEEFVTQVDVILSDDRVVKVDAILMTPQDEQRQREENRRRGRPDMEYGRILVPPNLIIESISEGHERHDRVLKRLWYAQSGVPNYWIFDTLSRSLECLSLEQATYRTDQLGQEQDEVRPSLFPGLVIPLAKVWPI